jgi:hypothetical protein
VALLAKARARKRTSPGPEPFFYARALTEAERLEIEDAGRVDGVDDEIALLRLRMREMVANSPERIDLQMDLAAAISRLVKTRYQISSQQKKSLKAAITRVLEEVAIPLGIGIGAGAGGMLRR